jgi:hypothetical protein
VLLWRMQCLAALLDMLLLLLVAAIAHEYAHTSMSYVASQITSVWTIARESELNTRNRLGLKWCIVPAIVNDPG